MTQTVTGGGRVVSCALELDVAVAAEIVLQIEAASSPAWRADGAVLATSDGRPLPVDVLSGEHGTRVGVLAAPSGKLAVTYRAELAPADRCAPQDGATSPDLSHLERIRYLRPSRYCPSDHLVGFAVSEFGTDAPARQRVEAVTAWIRQRVGYVPGSSSVHDSAEHTLLTTAGTCRDFAHLGVALCRALGVPARFASTYAPGLAPMDFHAVFEAWDGERWCAQDATGLAPRASMVRIATGRDAADTAFATVLSGIATLTMIDVSAIVTGTLPVDTGAIGTELR